MYEVVAAPKEQSDQAQEGRRENPGQGPSDPSSEQQPQGKPRCITIILNYAIYIYGEAKMQHGAIAIANAQTLCRPHITAGPTSCMQN